MKKYYILLKNGKYVCEEEWKYLRDVSSRKEATQLTEDEANKIIEHLGEGEKVDINENTDH